MQRMRESELESVLRPLSPDMLVVLHAACAIGLSKQAAGRRHAGSDRAFSQTAPIRCTQQGFCFGEFASCHGTTLADRERPSPEVTAAPNFDGASR